MSKNGSHPAIAMLGRKLRLAVIGGGPGSFIGEMHRKAARTSACYDLVAAALSSRPEVSKEGGIALGLPEDRIYTDAFTLISEEAKRENGADVIAIMTPNDSHFSYATAALQAGFDVICDKPLCNSLEEAEELSQLVKTSDRIFCLTHNYTGYPMVRQARAMVEAGELGDIRMIQVEYVQGGKSEAKGADPKGKDAPWRFDPQRGGPSLVLGDIGTHAHNLVRYICSDEMTEVAAETGAVVPDREIQDFAGALFHMSKGAKGNLWVTQAATGVENALSIRVCGSKASLEWSQEVPQRLQFKPGLSPWEVRTPGGPGTLPLGAHSTHIVAGHPEGFPEGFANIYRDAAEVIAARKTNGTPRPESLTYPKVEDGLAGVKFVKAMLQSSDNGSTWTKI